MSPTFPLPVLQPRVRVAQSLGVDPQTVDELIADGHLRATKVGRRTQVFVDSVKQYVERNIITPKSSDRELVTA